jgi:hypothetical protein
MKPMHVIRIAILGLGICGASPALAGISTSPSVQDDIIPIRRELVCHENDPSDEMDVLGQRQPTSEKLLIGQRAVSRLMFQTPWLAKVLGLIR